MVISGLQKLTLLDFPSNTACIIFTQGCNFNCAYCHNSELIPYNNEGSISEDELFSFLEKRKNMLDGIVISGGEPTVQKDLKEFIYKVKKLGYKVKLDTNGSNPNILKELINESLIDYVAMDVKTSLKNYEDIICSHVLIKNIESSIKILKESNIPHEFRMTIIKNKHDIKDIIEVCEYLGNKEKIYLQNFELSERVRDKTLESYTKDELKVIQNLIKNIFPNVIVRGL